MTAKGMVMATSDDLRAFKAEPKTHLDRGDMHTLCGRVIRGQVARRITDRAHVSCNRCIQTDLLNRERAA